MLISSDFFERTNKADFLYLLPALQLLLVTCQYVRYFFNDLKSKVYEFFGGAVDRGVKASAIIMALKSNIRRLKGKSFALACRLKVVSRVRNAPSVKNAEGGMKALVLATA
jgi:hypothetical protein